MSTQGPPTPWWLPQQGPNTPRDTGPASFLQNNSPAGYEYNPVQMQYTRTPTSAGQRVSEYTNAAQNNSLLDKALAGLNGTSSSSTSTGSTGGPVGSGTFVPPPQMPGGAPGGAPGMGSPGTGAGGSSVAALQMPDMTKSNAATFARAKGQVGQESRAALDSLNGEMGAQGMLGGGGQMQATRDIVGKNAENLGNVTRESAIQEALMKADVGKANYFGGITQRGQDIQKGESDANIAKDYALTGYQGGITQRGQDISAQEANGRLAIEGRDSNYQLLSLMLSGMGKTGATMPSSLLY